MALNSAVFTTAPDSLLQLLTDHLPHSLPLLRRLQSTHIEGGITPTARIIIVSDVDGNEKDVISHATSFSATYVDVGGGPDTQMWIYSTLEDLDQIDEATEAIYKKQLEKIIEELITVAKDYGKELTYPGNVLVGTLDSRVRKILESTGRVSPRPTGNYDKWLFRSEDLPADEIPLPEGLHWSTANVDDCRVVISRTDIPRSVKVLSRLPSLVIKLEDETPIAWAFLAFDGSLVSLHTEEPYRRKGLAKTLAAKLFRQGFASASNDGWGSADVAPDNQGSRGMCMSLNGKPNWVVSWILLNVRERIQEKIQ